MDDFFKGWRRKFGLVTLTIALAFMGVWVRSQFNVDMMLVSGPKSLYSIYLSEEGLWCFVRGSRPVGRPFFEYRSMKSKAVRAMPFATIGKSMPFSLFDDLEMGWHFEQAGFHIGIGTMMISPERQVWFFALPYWAIILPFSLISACCLLVPKRAKERP